MKCAACKWFLLGNRNKWRGGDPDSFNWTKTPGVFGDCRAVYPSWAPYEDEGVLSFPRVHQDDFCKHFEAKR